MLRIAGPVRPWFAAGCLLVSAAFATGCSNRTQPVVTPVPPTGPPFQPAGAFAVVLTQPLLRPPASLANPCAAPIASPVAGNPNRTVLYDQPGVATLINFSGDSVIAQAQIGFGPLTSAISPASNEVFSLNCDGTISGIPLSTTLQANNVTTTTLFSNVNPGSTTLGAPSIQSNAVVQNTATYVVNLNRDTVGALSQVSSSAPALLQEIAVAPAVVAVSASPTSQRVYAISQGATGSNVTFGQCATPNAAIGNGEADSIDTSTNAVTRRIPLGNCPVSGLTTPDGLRTFIMNRGSGTVTVINSQQDNLDTAVTSSTGQAGTINVGAGPVYAAYFPQRQLLVTANYDSGTISFIAVPLDSFGNDVPGVFGNVLATVPVGAFPAALTILGDGSRVYVALQGDPTSAAATGAIAVVNAVSFNLQRTIPVPGHPRSIASTYNNPIGKVYVVAPDSQLLTIVRTDTDIITAQQQIQGCGVDVHTNFQYAGQNNIAGTSVTATTIVNTSDSPGSGAPTTSFTPTTASYCQ